MTTTEHTIYMRPDSADSVRHQLENTKELQTHWSPKPHAAGPSHKVTITIEPQEEPIEAGEIVWCNDYQVYVIAANSLSARIVRANSFNIPSDPPHLITVETVRTNNLTREEPES